MTLARRVAPIIDVEASGELCGVYSRGGMDIRFVEAVAMFHAQDGADELWLRLRSVGARGAGGLFEPLKGLTRRVSLPLVAWGGVRSVADARLLVGLGAERVVVDYHDLDYEDPVAFVEQWVRATSPDRVAVALLTRRALRGGRIRWELCQPNGESLDQDALATAARLVHVGAGELVIQALDVRGDAHAIGQDAELVDTLTSALAAQVVSVGEVREAGDLATPLLMGADAVVSARLFAEGRVTVAQAKETLAGYGIPLRSPQPPYTAPR